MSTMTEVIFLALRVSVNVYSGFTCHYVLALRVVNDVLYNAVQSWTCLNPGQYGIVAVAVMLSDCSDRSMVLPFSFKIN